MFGIIDVIFQSQRMDNHYVAIFILCFTYYGFILHVQRHEGYPSGSMVDFACDHDGFPILAVSSLAVHTKVGTCIDVNCSLHCWLWLI